jgi:arsenate reductase
MKTRVLFLCVHNSARSQMAEALLRHLGGEAFEAYSAGSEPTQVHPFTLRVLQDAQINTAGLHSKHVAQFLNQPFDYVITLCDEEVCPVFPGAAARLHWGMPDPSAARGDSVERLEAFRHTLDVLAARVNEFIQTISVSVKE